MSSGAGSIRPSAAGQPAESAGQIAAKTPEPQAHLRLLENLNRIHQALQGSADVEQTMPSVLAVVHSMFGCDQVFLEPFEPEATSWTVPSESGAPLVVARDDEGLAADLAEMRRVVLDTEGPISFGPCGRWPLPVALSKRFGFQSSLSLALRPKQGSPWHFGLREGSSPRVWTPDEEALLLEIGRRLADGLTSLLATRDLRAREAAFRALAENSPDVIVRYDRECRRIYVNPEFERVNGVSAREILGKTPVQLSTALAPRAAAFTEKLQATMATGVASDIDLAWTVGGKHICWYVRAVPEYDSRGEVVSALTIWTDITARKAAEETIRRLNADLSATLQAIPDLLIEMDADGAYCQVWAHDPALLVREKEALIGRLVVDVLPPEAAQTVLATLREADEVGASYGKVIALDVAAGLTWFELSVTKKADVDGGGARFMVLARDITERKRAEAARTRSQKLESLGTLAGGIAHDFNNILTAIRGNADLAAEDLSPDHPAMESLVAIRQAGARATALVRRIMAFGRPEAPHRGVVDLAVVVDEVLNLLRSTLPAGVALRTHFERGVPPARVDASQVHEAIVNLTTNAVYAIGAHAGSIDYALATVELGSRQARALEVPEGLYAELSVADTGCGMDPATASRVFDAFFTTKPAGEGSGLGLSMVYGIVRGHGGGISVESEPGEGTCFRLYFPADRADAGREAEHVAGEARACPGERVLFVDDEAAIVSLARRSLGRFGHRVSGFTDPRAALVDLRAHPERYDVAVTDLAMPEMSGIELTRQLLVIRPDLPVIMTTGYLRPEDERRARAAGVRRFIQKPVELRELSELLTQSVREKRSAET